MFTIEFEQECGLGGHMGFSSATFSVCPVAHYPVTLNTSSNYFTVTTRASGPGVTGSGA